MSATLAPQTNPVSEPAPRARCTLVAVEPDPGDAELHRWLLFLGTPFVLGATFYALSIATSAQWLIGVTLAVGPMLLLLMTIYLCLTSDTNGERTLPRAALAQSARLRSRPAVGRLAPWA